MPKHISLNKYSHYNADKDRWIVELMIRFPVGYIRSYQKLGAIGRWWRWKPNRKRLLPAILLYPIKQLPLISRKVKYIVLSNLHIYHHYPNYWFRWNVGSYKWWSLKQRLTIEHMGHSGDEGMYLTILWNGRKKYERKTSEII